MPDGRLIVDAKLTRTGVFKYANPDGTIRLEYRPPSEVFDAESLKTFLLASVTNDHPKNMVTPDNAKAVTVGMIGSNVRKLDDHVAAELVIYDAQAIADVEAGKLELSCGYEADVEDSPGTSPSGERYDCIQSKIRINHVAIVDVGRAGPDARIHMDAADAVQVLNRETVKKKTDMDLVQALQKINELEVNLLTETARADKAEKSGVEATARADKAEAARDSNKERADKADKLHEDSENIFSDKVKARVKLCFDAKAVIDDELSELSDRDIKIKVVKAVTDFDITADHSDEYLECRHDMAIAQGKKSDESKNVTEREDREDVEGGSDDAEKAMLKRHMDRSKA